MPYDRATADFSELYYRRPLQGGGEKLVKAPYNLIRYPDSDATTYIEPEPLVFQDPETFVEQRPESIAGNRVVIDGDPFAGVTEIR